MAIQTPEFLQTKKYKAIRDRLALAHGGNISAGVWDNNDFLVSQRAAGATMSVDVNLGSALVAANSPSNKGLYHVESDAIQNVGIAASHATLPRIDQVILHVYDSTDGGASQDAGIIEVLTGTATSGVTLNAQGASPAALPTNCLKIADLVVPAASTTVVTANIRDRRPLARGTRVSNHAADSNLFPQSTWYGGGTITWEGNGRPLDVALGSLFQQSSAPANPHSVQVRLQVDGVDHISAVEVLYTPATPFLFHGWSHVRVIDPIAPGRHTMTVEYMDTSTTNGGSNAMALRRAYLRVMEA